MNLLHFVWLPRKLREREREKKKKKKKKGNLIFFFFFFEFLCFVRNDGMEDRYSVVIRLENQSMANGFYCNFNGKKFSPGEVDDIFV